jgi:hypothetical protein
MALCSRRQVELKMRFAVNRFFFAMIPLLLKPNPDKPELKSED